MAITVTTLVENSEPEHKVLRHEHGLSFHVKTPQSTFLFDCGATDALLHNAACLNIDLRRLDFIACSHAHYDHCGGFRAVTAKSGAKRLITGDNFFQPKYVVDGFRHTFVGIDFDPGFVGHRYIRHETVGYLLPVDDYCWLIGNIKLNEPAETIPANFFAQDDDGKLVPDRFTEEISLAVRFEDGLAVLVGCAHQGILNILRTASKRLNLPIRGVWGGTHLLHADEERLEYTVAAMKEMGIKYYGLSHCSGDAMLTRIQEDPDMQACHLRTGDGIFL